MRSVLQPHQRQISAASGLDVLAGVWVLVSPYVLHIHTLFERAETNNVICGAFIAILALGRFFGYLEHYPNVVLSIFNIGFGAWLIVSPWALGFSSDGVATANSVIAGLIVAALATWATIVTRTAWEYDGHDDDVSD